MNPSPLTGDPSTPPDLAAPGEAVDWTDPKATAQARRGAAARNASGRRSHVDPATCERDYSTDELEFMQAMQDYKQSSGRLFPTWSEVLEVLVALGYRKSNEDTPPDKA